MTSHEHIAQHAPDELTIAINAAVDGLDEKDGFTAAAARRTLEKSEW
jgi:hypothetical protein